ncbi:MAG: polyprenol monophosphomannose synthase [Rikenellaceae bacterium]
MRENLVIIPTYNEIDNITMMIDVVMALDGGSFDLLVIDDNSPDGTSAVVREKMAQYVGRIDMIERRGKLGLGSAYIAGFRWALEHDYDYIFEMDCDFSHNPEDLIRLRDAAHDGADVVVGSRYIQGVNVVNWPMSRLLLSYFASMYVRLVTRMRVMDATAGFVCYSRKVLEEIDLDGVQMQGYGFQIEMKYTAIKLGFTLREVSIIFTERREGASKMSGGIFGEALWGVMKLPFRSISKCDKLI